MYTYSYKTTTPSLISTKSSAVSSKEAAGILSAIMGVSVFFWILAIAAAVLTLVARWKVFKKANVDGWEALIPFHSDVVEMKLAGMHTGWWFLNLIAICGIGPLVFLFWKNIMLSKSFGKGAGFGVLLTFFPYVCYPILAFGKAEYVGPVSK